METTAIIRKIGPNIVDASSGVNQFPVWQVAAQCPTSAVKDGLRLAMVLPPLDAIDSSALANN
jgi:hypothetical protein